jgi:hypothetical protein
MFFICKYQLPKINSTILITKYLKPANEQYTFQEEKSWTYRLQHSPIYATQNRKLSTSSMRGPSTKVFYQLSSHTMAGLARAASKTKSRSMLLRVCAPQDFSAYISLSCSAPPPLALCIILSTGYFPTLYMHRTPKTITKPKLRWRSGTALLVSCPTHRRERDGIFIAPSRVMCAG